MRILNFTFLLAFLFLSSAASTQECFDASLGNLTLTPSDPATLDAPLVVEFEFCNDEDALPVDSQGALTIVISDSRLDPDGNPTVPSYLDAQFFFGTWILTQNTTIPAGACATIVIPWIVNDDAPSSNPSIGVNININPPGIMSGNDNCFTADDDNISLFTFTIDDAVPVDLISFTAEKEGKASLLTWETANEINNSHFEIEASINGTSFRNIGEVKGTNLAELSSYAFTDRNPVAGINYYRLKQVDFDGRFDYSDVKTVNFDAELAERSITVFPNPVVDFVRINTGVDENLNLRIYDVAGNLLMDNTIATGRDIDTSELASGVYLFKVLDSNNVLVDSKRIIVSK